MDYAELEENSNDNMGVYEEEEKDQGGVEKSRGLGKLQKQQGKDNDKTAENSVEELYWYAKRLKEGNYFPECIQGFENVISNKDVV